MALKKKNWGIWLIALILGFLWAYGLSTRIGLLFVAPLWLKAIILIGLGANFTFLAVVLFQAFTHWSVNNKTKTILAVLAVLLTAAIFLFAPYHSVPFRTAHSLTLTPHDSEVKLVEVLSPDDNLIDRNQFESSGDVVPFDVNGFRLSTGGTLSFRQSLTGSLTLVFTKDSGSVEITWDKENITIDPSQVLSNANEKVQGWVVGIDSETQRIIVSTPGYTWGQPDHLWMILGGLLPISDFICLSSLFLLAAWGLVGWITKSLQIKPDRTWAAAWLEALICFGLAVLLVKIDYYDFMPGWFLFLFLPAMLFLLYRQLAYFAQFTPGLSSLPKFSALIVKIQSAFTKINRSKWLFWVLILIVAVLATLAQLSLTKEGMGISGDSVHYMNSTINLAEGNGYVRTVSEGDPVLMTGFPPVYPVSLLPGVWTGIGVEAYARYENATLLFLTIILGGWLVYQATGKVLPAIWATSLVAMAPPILRIYSWMMSEPLFIMLLLVAFLLLQKYLQKPKKWLAIVIGLLLGIIALARLAAIAFVPVFALGLLLFLKSKFGKRLLNAVLLSLSALLPVAAFFIRNSLAATQVSESRGFTIAKFTSEYWDIIGSEVLSWFKWSKYFLQTYQQFNAFFITLGVIFLFILFWLIFRKKLSKNDTFDPIIILLLISIPAYLVLIILNTIFLTPLQTESGLSRYMIPILVLLFLSLGKILHDYWQASPFAGRLIMLFILVLLFSLYVSDTRDFVEKPAPFFRQYTDIRNECGEEVSAFIKTVPDADFVTNNCEFFYYMTGIPCNYLSTDDGDYWPGGSIYQILQEGTILAYSPSSGIQSESLSYLLSTLEPIESVCHMEFFAWPEE
ncbi:MAG: hypothetical protein H0S79_16330 [Anaerolineaceae bacterium]|nr:hypothetical protein [Anaerolineaceae bacterium]